MNKANSDLEPNKNRINAENKNKLIVFYFLLNKLKL